MSCLLLQGKLSQKIVLYQHLSLKTNASINNVYIIFIVDRMLSRGINAPRRRRTNIQTAAAVSIHIVFVVR